MTTANALNAGGGAIAQLGSFIRDRQVRAGLNRQARFIRQSAEQEAEQIVEASLRQNQLFTERAFELEEEGAFAALGMSMEAAQQRRQGISVKSAILANAAAHGVSGRAPLEVAAEAAYRTEYAASTTELQGRLMHRAALRQATEARRQGRVGIEQAQANARATVLTGALDAARLRATGPTLGSSFIRIAQFTAAHQGDFAKLFTPSTPRS